MRLRSVLLALNEPSFSTASKVSAVWTARGRPLPGARSIEPVARGLHRKSPEPRLLQFLFGNLLMNRLAPFARVIDKSLQPRFLCATVYTMLSVNKLLNVSD